jgi:hypothetical protein
MGGSPKRRYSAKLRNGMETFRMVSTHADSRNPTPYPELNAVLSHLVEGAKSSLKDNLIGAYLQGSFAVGDHI